MNILCRGYSATQEIFTIFFDLAYICPAMNKRIHQFTVVYLAIIVLLRMMAMPISLLNYTAHKGFIAAQLCENRMKPEMHCGGSCFLHKQLTKANESQESRDPKGSGKVLVVDFFEPAVDDLSCNQEKVSKQNAPFLLRSVMTPFIGSVFHPPIV
jgi:hypothetical protein